MRCIVAIESCHGGDIHVEKHSLFISREISNIFGRPQTSFWVSELTDPATKEP